VKRIRDEGMAHSTEAVRLDPKNARAHCDLGMALLHQGKPPEAIPHLSAALRHMPDTSERQYAPVHMRYNLGLALLLTRKFEDATHHLSEAVRIDPKNANGHYTLAVALAAQGDIDRTVGHYSRAMALKPEVDRSPTLHDLLGMNYARTGRFREAIGCAQKALDLARATGEEALAQEIGSRLKLYRQSKPIPTADH
jgi:superkiller protein 3